MARAQEAAPSNMIKLVELCDHFMCSCKQNFGDKSPDLLQIGRPVLEESKTSTPLYFSDSAGTENEQSVTGVVRRDQIIKAINGCDGPVITSSGVICGALDTLRKRQ